MGTRSGWASCFCKGEGALPSLMWGRPHSIPSSLYHTGRGGETDAEVTLGLLIKEPCIKTHTGFGSLVGLGLGRWECGRPPQQ